MFLFVEFWQQVQLLNLLVERIKVVYVVLFVDVVLLDTIVDTNEEDVLGAIKIVVDVWVWLLGSENVVVVEFEETVEVVVVIFVMDEEELIVFEDSFCDVIVGKDDEVAIVVEFKAVLFSDFTKLV